MRLGSSSVTSLFGYSTSHAGRQLPEFDGQIAATLRDLPLVSFVVQHAINSTAPKSVLGLGDYGCSFGLRMREVFVDVLHIDFHLQPRRLWFLPRGCVRR